MSIRKSAAGVNVFGNVTVYFYVVRISWSFDVQILILQNTPIITWYNIHLMQLQKMSHIITSIHLQFLCLILKMLPLTTTFKRWQVQGAPHAIHQTPTTQLQIQSNNCFLLALFGLIWWGGGWGLLEGGVFFVLFCFLRGGGGGCVLIRFFLLLVSDNIIADLFKAFLCFHCLIFHPGPKFSV